jgi:hypothetical protein
VITFSILRNGYLVAEYFEGPMALLINALMSPHDLALSTYLI